MATAVTRHARLMGEITSHREQGKILRAVALAYRRVMRAPSPSALTRTDAARPAEERWKEAVTAAIAEYRRLSPFATGDLPPTPVTREWGRESPRVRTSLHGLPRRPGVDVPLGGS